MSPTRYEVERLALAVAVLVRALPVPAPRFRRLADRSGEWWGTDDVEQLVPAGQTIRSVQAAYERTWREHRIAWLAESLDLGAAVERRALELLETDEDRLRFVYA